MADKLSADVFKDEDFEYAISELDKPNLEGWEFFVESHVVTIYRLFNESSGLYQYKVFGELDVEPDICAQVYMDLDYRKKWDSYVKELEEKQCEGKHLIYWEVSYPFPLWNRDYIYGRELKIVEKNGLKIWAVMAKSVNTPSVPERSGIVRVDDYLQSAVLCSNGKQGTKAFMHYYDNPKGNIPTWLINWAAKTGVPQFLTMMQAACRDYTKYLESKKGS
ncbi:phosphatidylcholine transfer protein [Biomphalaria glabrata]|nr:phosphatidylcholine transfer protein-like [Biomphalaria glabrata]